MKKNPAVSTLNITVFSVCAAILFQACSRKMDFGISQTLPAADGYVKLSTDKNNNTAIRVKIYHLAPPGRLNPPGSVYVVWMTTEHDSIRNIGQLKNMNLWFSKARVAGLKTVTPFKPSNFFVTAEDSGIPTRPRDQVLLKTE